MLCDMMNRCSKNVIRIPIASAMRLLSSPVTKRLPSSSLLMINNNLGHLPLEKYTMGLGTTLQRRTVHVDHNHSKEKVNLKTDMNSSDQGSKPARMRSRRTRTKRFSLDKEQVPSYKEFVHRFTVLSLYRGYLKCIRDSMPHNQEDLREQVRREFRLNMHDRDPFAVKRNIAEGQRQFEELQEFTGRSNKYKGESWINIKDPEDPRGRVGTGWPWAK